MISGSQVYQVARSVARGDGDWAEVPRCVREAIVLSLSTPHMAPAQAPGAARITDNGPSVATPSAASSRPAVLPPVLSEGAIQRSVQTFEDGAWMRDQAVRSYAQFHNSVETLHTGMRGQLRSLWHTAMQLNPRILDDVRRQHNLRPTDDIPDGVPLRASEAERIAQQEEVLEQLVKDLQRLRDSSVRFAAHWLTDREMMAMGANPAYLRPEEVDREARARAQAGSASRQRHRSRGSSASAGVSTHPSRRPSSVNGASLPPPSAQRERRGHLEEDTSKVRSHSRRHRDRNVPRDDSDERGETSDEVPRDDPELVALRRQYVARLAELAGRREQPQCSPYRADEGIRRGRRGSQTNRGDGRRDSPRRSSHRSQRHRSPPSADEWSAGQEDDDAY